MDGWVDPRFAGVREAFVANFALWGELGAAFAVTLDGDPVVDLWGGVADEATGREWREDTLVTLFSGTKALVALCVLMLVDRGELDLDAPVSRYWPEFAAEGKHDLRVADLVSHRARLPGIRAAVGDDEILDGRRMAGLLATQPQDGDPRAGDVYHALTYGWLCGEVILRVDGRSVGEFFAEEVARPLDLDIWIGLPPELEARVATLRHALDWGDAPIWDVGVATRDALLWRVWHNPPVLGPGAVPWNSREWRTAEIPGAGGIGTARSMARLFGCLARGGELDGERLVSRSTLERGVRELARRQDPLLDQPMTFGVGFQLQNESNALGPARDAFGHGGAGGSVHCAWPSQRVGLSYAMNLMRDHKGTDPRPQSLMAKVFEIVYGG